MQNWHTHEVANQPPELGHCNLFLADPCLGEAVGREAGRDWLEGLSAQGAALGEPHQREAAGEADRHPPQLYAYDRYGHRIDEVRFHPAWHALMHGIVARGLHNAPWADPAPGSHVARAAGFYLQGQVESGTLCPTTMTYAGIPLLQAEADAGVGDLARDWLPALLSRRYDPSDAPAAAKSGLLLGMGLTEKQGGSDLRATATHAEPEAAPGRGRAYRLVGHKWFYSVPQADGHLVLARDGQTLSCFLVPRILPDGTRNAVRLRRLKDKLGNRSNASAEVEFEQAWGLLVGEPGRGIATLMGMAAHTRLDCALGSAALLRQALVTAMHHARHRHAFGAALAAQPLMAGLLADLALESEASMALCLRLAGAYDRRGDPAEAALARVGTPAAKLWVCKRAAAAVGECMEVLGGNGYVEESSLPRLYREAPVNSIWEGAGNMMALDVVRALRSDGAVAEALRGELGQACGSDPIYDRAWQSWQRQAGAAADDPAAARRVAAGLARLWQAALLMRHAPPWVADAFVAGRLQGGHALFGELPGRPDLRLAERAWPL